MTRRSIFQGEIGEIQFPDLLTFLDMLGKTGTLEARRGIECKRVHLDKGEIIFAESTSADQQLPEYLCRNGFVPREVVAAARANARTEYAVVGVLVREGSLEPSVLLRATKSLVLDTVYSLFEWTTGSFTFDITSEPHPERVALRTSISNTIVEGCRRLDEWQRIRERFASDDVHPVPSTSPGGTSVKLPPVEQEILGWVDGKRRVSDIVHCVSHDAFTVLGALLTLLNAGLITVSAESVPPTAPAATRGNGSLPEGEARAAEEIVAAFNNIFRGMHSRISTVKGQMGVARFAATLQKETFQRVGIFSGVQFSSDGTIPASIVLSNVAQLPDDDRLSRLKGSFDRLLAQQVLQMDTSYPPEDKKAISELISKEKSRLAHA